MADQTVGSALDDRSSSPRSGRGLREPVNTITHLVGAVAALVATVPLVALTGGDWQSRLATLVFGLTSVLLFGASAALHGVWASPRGEVWLRRLDHAAIFTLIAGTYTPILVVAVRPDSPRLAWTVLAVVWGIAACGVVFKLLWIEAPRWLYGRTWGEESRSLKLEGRVPDGVATELRRRGHDVTMLEDWSDKMGHAQAILIDRTEGSLHGGADPRGDGVAIGH